MITEFLSWGSSYNRFKNDPVQCRAVFLELARTIVQELMTTLDIKGYDLEDIASGINAYAAEVKQEPSVKIEGNRIVYRNRSFCQVIVPVRAFSQSWL